MSLPILPLQQTRKEHGADAADEMHGASAVKDAVILGALVVSFATLVATHIALSARLMWRVRPWWHGLVSLVIPPLGVLWAFRAGFLRLAVLWIGALIVYLVALVAAQA